MKQPRNKLTNLQATTPFVIAVVFGLPAVWIFIFRPDWGDWEYVVFGVCGAVLVFDLPVCILILIGRPPAMTLAPLFPSSEQKAFHRNLRQRPALDDDAFYDRFYSGSGIAKEIVIRIRKELKRALGLNLGGVRPDDNVALAYDDIDFADVLWRLSRTFDVHIPQDACWDEIDGTFDSLVRYVAKHKAGPDKQA